MVNAGGTSPFFATRKPSGWPSGMVVSVRTCGMTARLTGRLRSRNGRYSRSRQSHGVSALVSSSRRITVRMHISGYLQVEILHSTRQHCGVVFRAHQFPAGGGVLRPQFRTPQTAINDLVKGLRRIEVKDPAVLAVPNQIEPH